MSIGIALLVALQSAPAIALPAKTDIPADLGGVTLCADDATARTMFETFYVDRAGSTLNDLDVYFAGLQATGCVQSSGPLTISRVDQRKKLGNSSYIRFAGLTPARKAVYGIVNEDNVITHPRTDLERWTRSYYDDGALRLKATPGNAHAYICATPDAARKFVRSIPDASKKGITKSVQLRMKKNALKIQKCSLAKGVFTITAVHEVRSIDIAFEVEEVWTALTALDARGRTVGIVFDASLI